jgi:hypothetical protein
MGFSVLAGACHGSEQTTSTGNGGTNGTSTTTAATTGSGGSASGPTGSSTTGFPAGATSSSTGSSQGFDVQPSMPQTISVQLGQSMPTVGYTATLNGNPVNVGWQVDHGDIGKVGAGPSSTATFTPSGTTGGNVNVIAGLNGQTLTRSVLVKLTATQNGSNPQNPLESAQIPMNVAALTQGGGVGGVGGEGLGPAVTDTAALAALGAPSGNGAQQGLAFLYPYDKTVWPRGILAPLLQWNWSIGDADAIQIQLSTTSGSFSYTGTFARPAILQMTGGKFIRHPIPQDIWNAATDSAGGSDKLTVSLIVEKGGMAYGPITETWSIAPARLSGTIYYNSYGTLLVQNSTGAVGGNGMFGAGVLSIRVGDTGPKVVAGSNSACRTCHSVAAFGSRLEAMPYGNYSAYDLTPSGATEHVMPNAGAWFPAVYPDGSKLLTGDGQLLALPNGGAAIATTGLASSAPDMPMFSPDGKRVAFNPGVGSQLVMQSFDNATSTFSGTTTVVASTGGLVPGWPAFFPDANSIVFENESAPSALDGHGQGLLWTREGAKSQIAWASAAGGGSTPLDQLNGKGYLPKLAAPISLSCLGDNGYQEGTINPDHGDDVDLNYEPTVNPIAGGGYAWVVFTSRRMYGNEADIPPFCSDPRGVNLVTNITTKKLWVAAVDLTQAPGTDSSHPAFYLPAQELLAGNSRGFWALDPCKGDGSSCTSGDQCCNGYCEPDAMNNLVCANTPPNGMCAMVGDKCTTAGDCCDSTNLCVNGFCTQKGPM